MTDANASKHKTTFQGLPKPEYDPAFTDHVINATGPKANPRLKYVLDSFIRHIHSFAREVDLTTDEWMAAVNMINWAGKMSTDKRNEGQLMCDVIGLESLVDEITYKIAAQAADTATASAILGPFWRHDAPERQNGDSIMQNGMGGEICWMHGQVVDGVSGSPIPGASVDVWEAGPNGLYEQQDENQAEHNLRGKFLTDDRGMYNFYCLRPTPYPIPNDGPAGKLLGMLDRHPMRPAHIHMIVIHNEYKPLTTQIFDREGAYLDDDAAFAVKDSLVVDFVPRKDDLKATLELEYNVKLVPQKPNCKHSISSKPPRVAIRSRPETHDSDVACFTR